MRAVLAAWVPALRAQADDVPLRRVNTLVGSQQQSEQGSPPRKDDCLDDFVCEEDAPPCPCEGDTCADDFSCGTDVSGACTTRDTCTTDGSGVCDNDFCVSDHGTLG